MIWQLFDHPLSSWIVLINNLQLWLLISNTWTLDSYQPPCLFTSALSSVTNGHVIIKKHVATIKLPSFDTHTHIPSLVKTHAWSMTAGWAWLNLPGHHPTMISWSSNHELMTNHHEGLLLMTNHHELMTNLSWLTNHDGKMIVAKSSFHHLSIMVNQPFTEHSPLEPHSFKLRNQNVLKIFLVNNY